MNEGRVVAQHVLLPERKARFREVVIGRDGAIFALTESVGGAPNSGELLRMTRLR